MTVTLRGVSNKHCLLPLFSFVLDLVGNPEDRVSHDAAQLFAVCVLRGYKLPMRKQRRRPAAG